jgi:hypothetical protein
MGVLLLSTCLPVVILASPSSVLFAHRACPAIALATADLPMGKKRKTLCARACRAIAFCGGGWLCGDYKFYLNAKRCLFWGFVCALIPLCCEEFTIKIKKVIGDIGQWACKCSG